MKSLPLALALGLLPLAPAHADCANATDQTTLNACAAQRARDASQRLSRLSGAYRQRLDAGQSKAFQGAQQAWAAFRDQDCRFQASAVEGGSAHGMVLNDCLAAKTEARIKELQALAGCQEGDLSCPAPRP